MMNKIFEFSASHSYYFTYKEKDYIVVTSWDDNTSYFDTSIYDENDKRLSGDEADVIEEAFAKEFDKKGNTDYNI